ncbi:hypothetical protein K2Z84_25785 [Candidatus Binatia bacterium]|nr:hypothetical protein [Candidatus Binatia bacterium]
MVLGRQTRGARIPEDLRVEVDRAPRGVGDMAGGLAAGALRRLDQPRASQDVQQTIAQQSAEILAFRNILEQHGAD